MAKKTHVVDQHQLVGWFDKNGAGADNLAQMIFSDPQRKGVDEDRKWSCRPILLKGEKVLQKEIHRTGKVFHETAPMDRWMELLNEGRQKFRQVLLQFDGMEFQLFYAKDDAYRILKKVTAPVANGGQENEKGSKGSSVAILEHNRRKNHVLQDGHVYPFLVKLGIMNAEGRVLKDKYDKFRQLNRYLEFVRDALKEMPEKDVWTIVDFGCGKAYLTFALYHYLVVELGQSVRLIGLDLKADVITYCQGVANELGFEGLIFEIGDISAYEGCKEADMVISLHACDTATDASLAKAVGWQASVIFAVPCCQHELYSKVENEALSSMLKHGLLKERFAALATDALRGMKLECFGYKVQMVEFIDMAHTPKNILIRAYKQSSKAKNDKKMDEAKETYEAFKKTLGVADMFIDEAFKEE